MRALHALQILLRLAGYARTHVMMLHSEFCAVWLFLSDVLGQRILLINIHNEQ